MSTALFELDDFEETRVEWVPLFKPFGLTLLSLITPDRCRDCGQAGANEHRIQGSRQGVGTFVLCDDCASLEPHWGIRPTDTAQARAEQNTRRLAYLYRKAAA